MCVIVEERKEGGVCVRVRKLFEVLLFDREEKTGGWRDGEEEEEEGGGGRGRGVWHLHPAVFRTGLETIILVYLLLFTMILCAACTLTPPSSARCLPRSKPG